MDTLETIIKTRSTQRKFSTKQIPTKEEIEKIIEAGIYAPFPGLGTDRATSPRQFIVLENGWSEWIEIKNKIVKKGKTFYKIAKKQKLLRLAKRG